MADNVYKEHISAADRAKWDGYKITRDGNKFTLSSPGGESYDVSGDISISATAPADTSRLWVDITENGCLKYYFGGEWRVIRTTALAIWG